MLLSDITQPFPRSVFLSKTSFGKVRSLSAQQQLLMTESLHFLYFASLYLPFPVFPESHIVCVHVCLLPLPPAPGTCCWYTCASSTSASSCSSLCHMMLTPSHRQLHALGIILWVCGTTSTSATAFVHTFIHPSHCSP